MKISLSKKQSVSIRDIAKVAGVSIGSVSRALKDQPGLSEPTRKMIQRVAISLGYDFERLRAEPIRRIVFLLHRQHNTLMANPFFSAVLHGAEDACRQHDALLSFLAVGPADPVLAQLGRHDVDALICAGFFEPELLDVFKQAGKPMALIDQYAVGFACINLDNEQGGYLATKHLLDQGRRKVAFVASSLAHYSIQQRERGYRRALFDAQVLTDPAYCMVAPQCMDVEQGIEYAMRQLLALPQRPDAIFAYNDAAALIILRICQEVGLSVPGDIAIVGFDDVEMASLSHPALTTIQVDKDLLGRRGVEMVMQRSSPCNETLPTQLVVRASS